MGNCFGMDRDVGIKSLSSEGNFDWGKDSIMISNRNLEISFSVGSSSSRCKRDLHDRCSLQAGAHRMKRSPVCPTP